MRKQRKSVTGKGKQMKLTRHQKALGITTGIIILIAAFFLLVALFPKIMMVIFTSTIFILACFVLAHGIYQHVLRQIK